MSFLFNYVCVYLLCFNSIIDITGNQEMPSKILWDLHERGMYEWMNKFVIIKREHVTPQLGKP